MHNLLHFPFIRTLIDAPGAENHASFDTKILCQKMHDFQIQYKDACRDFKPSNFTCSLGSEERSEMGEMCWEELIVCGLGKSPGGMSANPLSCINACPATFETFVVRFELRNLFPSVETVRRSVACNASSTLSCGRARRAPHRCALREWSGHCDAAYGCCMRGLVLRVACVVLSLQLHCAQQSSHCVRGVSRHRRSALLLASAVHLHV